MATKTKKKPPAKLATSTKGNTKSPAAQQQGKLVKAPGAGASSASKKKKKAKKKKKGDPVNVVTGAVVEQVTDLEIDDPLLVDWARSYTSERAAAAERSPAEQTGSLGRGWCHSFQRWLEIEGQRAYYHDEEGDTIELAVPAVEQTTFHRGSQVELSRTDDDKFEVFFLDDRITEELSPVVPGGPPMLRVVRDAWGNRITLAYEDGVLTSVTDPVGREIRVLGDPAKKGRIKRVELWAEGKLFEGFDYAYSEEGDLIAGTNALGHAHRYEYDGQHRIVRKKLKNGFQVRYLYDEDTGRCVKTWGDDGFYTVELTYDLDKHTTTTHGEAQPRVFHWDLRGAVLSESTFDGQLVETSAYDDDLLLLSTENAAGEAESFEYDARGHLVKYTDPAGNVTAYEIEDDLLVRETLPDGLERRYLHDRQGEVREVVYPSGEIVTLSRDGRGNVTGVFGPDGFLEKSEFDEKQNLVRWTDARNMATAYTYDPLGQPLSETDSLGRVTQFEYDVIGQIVAVTLPDGTILRQEYDPNGEIQRVERPTGEIRMEYTGSGVLSRATFEDGQSWSFTYDREEKPRTVTNPRGERFEYRYDSAGRVIEERTFDGRTLRYRYDKASRLSRIEHTDETWRELSYDPLGNLLVDDSPHGRITFDRDELGEIKRATFEEGPHKSESVYEHDRLGRILAEIHDGQAVRYELDEKGRVGARQLPPAFATVTPEGGAAPEGPVTRYYYDLADDLAGIDHQGHKILIQRDAAGREVRTHVYAGMVDIVSRYDAMDRLLERRGTRPSPEGQGMHDLLMHRIFDYDPVGRLRIVSDRRFGQTSYRYDPLGRLTEMQRAGKLQAFEYDAAGSISAILTSAAAPKPFSIRQGNRLRRTEEAEYDHDLSGRLVRKTTLVDGEPVGDVTEYVWDCRDQLRDVLLPDGGKIRYFYDAFGRRTQKEIWPAPADKSLGAIPEKPPEPRIVRFLWDGDCLAAETDTERGNRVFVFDPGEMVPLLQAEQGEVFTYVRDHIGTPKELIDAQGRIAWAATHDAFNQVTEVYRDPAAKRPRPIESPFRSVGQYADEETGFFYNRFRYFDPSVGRFLSPDPLGLDGGMNLFALDGAPTWAVDPFGLAGVNDPGYQVYGIYKKGSSTPFYVGITNQGIPARREQHRKTGRFNNGCEMRRLPGTPATMTHAESRGHEQFNIEKYGTRKGKYGNRQASFRKNRKDWRGKRFKAEYNKLKKAAAAKAKKAGKAKKAKGSK